jgi:hypothetical protein
MAVHKMFKLHKDRTIIAGVAVKGNGTVSYSETAQTVSPQGGLRIGNVCVVSITETLSFSIEDPTTASCPRLAPAGRPSSTHRR